MLARNIRQKAIVIALVSGKSLTTKEAELTERRAIVSSKNLLFSKTFMLKFLNYMK